MSDDWDGRAETYRQLEWANRRGLIDAIIGELDPQPGDFILDAGAGIGSVSVAVAPVVKYVCALDKSQAMLDKVPFRLNIRRELGDVMAMRFFAETFDGIVMRQVLHLVEDPLQALWECHRVLRRGSRMVLVEGIPPHLDLMEWFAGMLRTVKDRYVFSTDDLYDLMQHAGFSIVRQALYVEPQVSISNWLANSQVDSGIAQQVLRMHRELDERGKRYYNMAVGEDICCDFHFLILVGRKG